MYIHVSVGQVIFPVIILETNHVQNSLIRIHEWPQLEKTYSQRGLCKLFSVIIRLWNKKLDNLFRYIIALGGHFENYAGKY